MSSFREDLRREDLRLVQRAIDAMPPHRRHVFILHRVHGRSIREIATETGLSAASIGQHLEAALLVLVRAIAESENGQDGGGRAGGGGSPFRAAPRWARRCGQRRA